MMFQHDSNLGLAGALRRDLKLQPSVTYLVALSASTVELVENTGVCFIEAGPRYNMAILFTVLNSKKHVKQAVLPLTLTSKRLPFVI